MPTACVVYNRTPHPVTFSGGVVNPHEWRYIEDRDSISRAVEKGTLIVADPDLTTSTDVDPGYARAVAQMQAARPEDAADQNADQNESAEDVPEEEPTPKKRSRKKSPEKQNDDSVRDTETSSNDQAEQEG